MAMRKLRGRISGGMSLSIKTGKEESKIFVLGEGPTIIIGLNASLKSVIARTFLDLAMFSLDTRGAQGKFMYLPESLEPTLASLNIEHEFSIDEGLFSGGFLIDYIPDSRIVTRSFLQVLHDVKDLEDDIRYIVSGEDARAEDIIGRIRGIISRMGLQFVENYLKLKQSALMPYYTGLRGILSEVVSEAADELGIDADELLPLDVDVSGYPDETFGGWDVKVVDKRLGRIIPAESVSTSVSSFLLMNYVMLLVANVDYKNKLVVIEEPEQAMAPPQQVIFARFLSRIYQYMSEHRELGNLFMIVTTHSPYIGLGIKRGRHYYVSLKKGEEIEVLEGKPGLTFIMADLLRLKYVRAEEREE